MKKHLLVKTGCTMLIGFFAAALPVTSVQAADFLDRIRMEHLGGGWTSDTQSSASSGAAAASKSGDMSTAQGAQGPMRMDMTDRSVAQDREAYIRYNQDVQKRLDPIGGAGTN